MENIKIKVSICIPAYNQPRSLERLLDSIKDQNYLDYEIVLTDDSTIGGVFDVVMKYNFDGRLKYGKNEVRLGTPKNWNRAIELASGEYIKIMHHDDWFCSPDSLRRFVASLDENKNSDFVFSRVIDHLDDKDEDILRPMNDAFLLELKKNPFRLLGGNLIGPPCSVIYRKKAHQEFDENLKWNVDFDFYIRILMNNNNFIYIDAPLVKTLMNSPFQVSAECVNNKDVVLKEYFYVFNLMDRSFLADYHLKELIRILRQFKISSFKELHNICTFILPEDWTWNIRLIFFVNFLRKTKNYLLKLFNYS